MSFKFGDQVMHIYKIKEINSYHSSQIKIVHQNINQILFIIMTVAIRKFVLIEFWSAFRDNGLNIFIDQFFYISYVSTKLFSSIKQDQSIDLSIKAKNRQQWDFYIQLDFPEFEDANTHMGYVKTE